MDQSVTHSGKHQEVDPAFSRIHGEAVASSGTCVVNGARYRWHAVRRWGKLYYSFDLGTSWAATKREAFGVRKSSMVSL